MCVTDTESDLRYIITMAAEADLASATAAHILESKIDSSLDSERSPVTPRIHVGFHDVKLGSFQATDD